jgi:hypothetical protein
MIDRSVAEVVREARSGAIDPTNLQQLTRSAKNLRESLRESVSSIDPNEYIKAVQFMNHLTQTISTLQQPNASSYFNGSLAGMGDNVAALVDDMTRKGLRFSSAVSGQEPDYNALYSALVTYDVGLSKMAGGHQ